MKKIKITIIAFLLAVIFLASYVAAADVTLLYTRTGGSDIKSIATVFDDPNNEIYIDGDYSANALGVTSSDVKVYNYNTTTEQTCTGSEAQLYSQNKYYYKVGIDTNEQVIYYTLKFGAGDQKATNVATFIYTNGLKYKGKNYDIKLNLKEIRKKGDNEQVVKVSLGKRAESQDDLYTLSTYTNKTLLPQIGAEGASGNNVEMDIEYIILDKNGNEYPVSGVLGLTDIDLNQGMYVDGYIANSDNTYMRKDIKENNDIKIDYKTIDNKGTYIFTTDAADTNQASVYSLINNKSKINMCFTFNELDAYSSIRMTSGVVKAYKRIDTSVVGGTITDSITNIKDGENKTITYSPNDADKQYLKSITVDGTEIPLDDNNKSSYTFSNIKEDHEIRVVYENKYKVTYDAKGGTPTPETEYVNPNEKATRPSQNPTKNGYTFNGWKEVDSTSTDLYNFDTPVVKDTDLEANWTPIIYNITYVLNGGTNDPENPSQYTVEDTIDFKNPTRDGYTFLGWYSDPEFTTRKDGISNETGDKTVYAKWEPRTGTPYTVEHYKETTDGKYELVVTDSLTGVTDSTATATPKEYTGFVENTTHEDRVPSGIITADGKLVLKLYYDKIKYKVTFDTKIDKKIDTQTVKYQEKATEPTKLTSEGYTFQYWYYVNEEGKEVQYDFDSPVTSDVHLIAKWNKNVKPASTDKQDVKVLPNTGRTTSIVFVVISVIGLVGIVFWKKYSKLNKLIK